MATVLRPLSFSELLDRTFFLYRKNFLLFVGITVVPYLAILATELVGVGLVFAKAIYAAIPIIVLGILIYLLAAVASQAATVVAVSDVHLERSASIAGSFRAIKGSFLRILLVMLGMWICLAMACTPAVLSALLIAKFLWAIPLPFLLGIPVIALMIAWSLIVPVTVLEGTWLIGSMKRSFFLTKDSLWKIFLVFIIFMCLAFAVVFIVEIPMIILEAVLAAVLAQAKNGMTAILVMYGLNYVVSFIASTLIAPLFSIGIALIYFDQRVRKEGFDLQLMMATLQPAPMQAGVSAALPQP